MSRSTSRSLLRDCEIFPKVRFKLYHALDFGRFAERADRIILLFDAHKLDISDEFKNAIEAIRSHDDKIRICLNKADMMTHQQLMR